MASLQPSAPTEQPPPDLPNMPDVSDTLSRYLRTFSLWCRNGFRDKLTISASLPGVLIQATDQNVPNPAVYKFGVTTPGVAILTPIALGSGDEGTPVPLISSVGGTITGSLQVNGTFYAGFYATPLNIAASGVWTYAGFYDSGGTRRGYVGYNSSGYVTLNNDAGANLSIYSGSANFNVLVNAPVGVSFGNWGYGGYAIRLDFDPNNWGIPILINGGSVVGSFSCLSTSHSDSTYTAVRNWALRGSDGQVVAWYNPSHAWNWANGASDIRLKTNIRPAQKDALAAINALSVVECDLTYPFPDAKPHHWNWAIVSNEDLGEKIPSAYIPAGKDPDTHAIIRELTVIAALVKAVQQLSARVEELEAR
jgi:hypothetical protein